MIEKAPREIEVTNFNFLFASQVNVLTNNEETLSSKTPVQLVAASSKYGLIFAGYDQGIKVYKFDDLFPNDNETLSTPIRVVPLMSPPTVIALNADNFSLAVGQQRDGFPCADLYDTRAFLNKEASPSPYLSVRLSSSSNVHIRELVWNPVQAQIFAACLSDGFLGVYEALDNGLQIMATLPPQSEVTAISWSPKGKQLVAGKQSGTITQYKPENLQEVKSFPPPKFEKPVYVTSILWISTTQFAVGYASKSDPTAYFMMVNVQKGGGATFVQYYDPCCSSGDEREPRFLTHHLSEWSLLLCACTNSLEVAILGASQENKSTWVQWLLESSGRAELPLVKKEETFPMGMAVLTCAEKPIIISENESYGPMPILLVYSTSGTLCSFHMVYNNSGLSSIVAPAQTLSLNGERKPMSQKNPPPNLPSSNAIKSEPIGGSFPPKSSFPVSSSASSPFSQPPSKNVTFNLGGDIQGTSTTFTPPKPPSTVKTIPNVTPAFAHSPAQPTSFTQSPQQPSQVIQPISPAASSLPAPSSLQVHPGPDQQQLAKLGAGSTAFLKPMPSKPLSPILEQESISPNNESFQKEAFIKAIQDEIKEFDNEIQNLRQNISSTNVCIGRPDDLIQLNKDVEMLSNFMEEMKITTESLASDIHALRSSCLEQFASIHEARAVEAQCHDENYLNLVRSRALDPVAARRLKEIKSTYFYLTSQLKEAHARLDQDWNVFLDKAKIKRESKQTTLDTIYRTLVTHQNLAYNLSQQLQTLTEKMKSLKIFVPSTTKAWTTPFDLNQFSKNETELSSLADSLLQVSVSAPPPKPKPKKLSSDLQLRLADFLAHRPVSYIKPSELKSVTDSKLISTIQAQSFPKVQTPPSIERGERLLQADFFKTVPKDISSLSKQQPVLSIVTMPTSLPSRGITSGLPLSTRPQNIPKTLAEPDSASSLFGRPPVNESTPKASVPSFRTPNPTPSRPSGLTSFTPPPHTEFKPVYENITPPSSPMKSEAGTIVIEVKDGAYVKSGLPETTRANLSPLDFNIKLAPNAVVTSSFNVVNNKQAKEKLPNKIPPSTMSSTAKPVVSSTFTLGQPTPSTRPAFVAVTETASPFGKPPSAFASPESHSSPSFAFTPPQPVTLAKSNASFPGVGQVVGSKALPDSSLSSPQATLPLSNTPLQKVTTSMGLVGKSSASLFTNPSQASSTSAILNATVSSTTSVLPKSLPSFPNITLPASSTFDSNITTSQSGNEVTSKPFIPISTSKTPIATKPLESSKEGEISTPPPASKQIPTSKVPQSSSPTINTEAAKSQAPVSSKGPIVSPLTSNKSVFGQSNNSSPDVNKSEVEKPSLASNHEATDKIDQKDSLKSGDVRKKTEEPKTAETFKEEIETIVTQAKSPVTSTSVITFSSTSQQSTPAASEAKSTASSPTTASSPLSNSIFGQSKSSSVFNQPVSSTASLFGKPTSAPSLFGQPTSTATTTSSQTSAPSPAFGQSVPFGQTNTTSSSPFGSTTTTTSTSSLHFGQTTSAPLFGQGTAGTSIFGQASSGSLFGKPTTTSIFGQTTSSTTPLFGQVNTSTSAFGRPVSSPSLFGQTSSSTPSVFGQSVSTPSVFGQSNTSTPSAFAQPTSQTTSVFGQPVSSSSTLFGKPTVQSASPFGQTTQTTLFGQPTSSSSSPFGQSSGSVFGQTSLTSPFGQPTSSSSSVFGQASQTFGQTSIFGKPAFNAPAFGQPSTFGQPVSTQSSVFGQSPTFGQTGSSTFGQSQTSNIGGFFGGAFSGLGSTGPSTPNKNVFGSPSTFGSQATQQTSLFGTHGAQTFGGSKFGGSGFTGGSFSTGAGGSVAQAGFGAVQQQSPPKTGGFGSPPTFGSSSAFGSPPSFGGSPTFGGGGLGDGSSSAFGSSASGGFAAYANSSSTSFGALAAQSGGTGGFGQASPQPQQQQFGSGFGSSTFGQQSQQPTFGTPTTTGAAFSQWR